MFPEFFSTAQHLRRRKALSPLGKHLSVSMNLYQAHQEAESGGWKEQERRWGDEENTEDSGDEVAPVQKPVFGGR